MLRSIVLMYYLQSSLKAYEWFFHIAGRCFTGTRTIWKYAKHYTGQADEKTLTACSQQDSFKHDSPSNGLKNDCVCVIYISFFSAMIIYNITVSGIVIANYTETPHSTRWLTGIKCKRRPNGNGKGLREITS